eukprot:jgi/Botrbrau1/17990/Bobra.0460s0006.1
MFCWACPCRHGPPMFALVWGPACAVEISEGQAGSLINLKAGDGLRPFIIVDSWMPFIRDLLETIHHCRLLDAGTVWQSASLSDVNQWWWCGSCWESLPFCFLQGPPSAKAQPLLKLQYLRLQLSSKAVQQPVATTFRFSYGRDTRKVVPP